MIPLSALFTILLLVYVFVRRESLAMLMVVILCCGLLMFIAKIGPSWLSELRFKTWKTSFRQTTETLPQREAI